MSYDVTALSQIKYLLLSPNNRIKEFSGATVITLLVQVIFIVIDRYLYFIRPLPSNSPTTVTKTKKRSSLDHLYYETYKVNNYALLGKFLLHILQVVLVHFVVFWYLPNEGNVHLKHHPECRKEDIAMGKCNEPPNNPFLFLFYVIYCIYFIGSALQIQYGWPEIEESMVVKSSDTTSKIATQVFYAIPFAWELQQIASWLWTKTSFNIFQWLKFGEIYNNLFLVKCEAKVRRQRQVGEEVTRLSKYLMGGCGLFILIFLIIAPIFVFSTLNPMVNLNNPTKASLVITLDYGESESFELMRVSGAALKNVTELELEWNQVREFEEVRGADTSQFQWVMFSNSSDYNSFPTEDKRQNLAEYLAYENPYPVITVKLTFVRPEPAQKQQVELKFSKVINDEQWYELYYLFSQQLERIHLEFPDLFCSAIVLPLNENPRMVDQCWENPVFPVNLTLNLTMKYFHTRDNEQVPVFHTDTVDFYWFLLAVSEKSRTSIFAGYSLITLYVSVVLVIGRLLRGFLSGASFKILYEDMPKPGALLRLCTGVIIARYENNLLREGELYWELIEVLRSTEVMKLITKSSKDVYFFKKKDKREEERKVSRTEEKEKVE